MGSENLTGPGMPFPQTIEIPDTRYYQVKMAAGEDGCSHCGAGKMWAIVYVEHGQTEETEIGQTFGDHELTEDICDLMNMAYEAGLEGYRCFHCDELFKTHAEAILHFGKSEHSGVACSVDIAQFREFEDQLWRYRQEDTELHREIQRMQADHATALRREEEKGYARGLRDAGYAAKTGADHE